MKITYLPTGANFRGWRTHSRQAIITASGRPREGQIWIDQVETLSIVQLHDDGEFGRLSANITQCLITLYREKGTGPLRDRVLQLDERYAINRQLLPGRVVYKTIVDYHKADELDLEDHDIGNLQAVLYNGDLAAFLSHWDRVLMHNTTDVGFKLKAYHLKLEYKKMVKDNEDIRNDYIVFKRRHRDRDFRDRQDLYEFLYKSIHNAIDDNRREKALADANANLKQGNPKTSPSAALAPTMKPKDRTKGKKTNKGDSTDHKLPDRRVTAPPEGCSKGNCWDYYVHGKCVRHDLGQCDFKHELRAPSGDNPTAKAKAKSKGAMPNSKNQQCGFFAAGRCKNGVNCQYLHGADDPRPRNT